MTEVLKKELLLTPENEKTNIPLAFSLDKEYEKMRITYSYSPKELTEGDRARELTEKCLLKDTHGDRELYPSYESFLPLKNLVTLSLDSPEGYRGAAHRQAKEQCHILTENSASPGFLEGRITEGEWALSLNVHAIVTEKCICKVLIEVGGEDDE